MNSYPIVPLSSVLRVSIDAVPSATLDSINLAGVYSFGKGLFKRGTISPLDTTYKTYHRLNTGDFVISSPKAWEGALSVIDNEFDGWFLSSVFPTFRADPDRLDTNYLNWYCKRRNVWQQLQDKSRGMGARRESVSASRFLDLKIPLPEIAEQKHIVKKLNTLADKSAQIEFRLKSILNNIDNLLRSYVFYPGGDKAERHAMSKLVSLKKPDVKVVSDQRYDFAGVYSFGKGVFTSSSKYGDEFSYDKLSTVRAGDFIYPKLMAWEGAMGIVPCECDGLVVSPEFPVFSINTDIILPEVIDIYYRTPEVWPALAEISGGTNMRRRRLQPSSFLNYEMPVPPMNVQMEIRRLYQYAQELKNKQLTINKANSSLISSMLETIFS
ncbi:restriction endonuclease subunit S [Enterobacter hormaechei]|uniref:restriction endonuclease subunit S n=1 Tax=Enterobacter hormaechei TaxID=158836 RepID=UPI000796A1A3|nr:restriction endonuclease subunit S [Enterobacter hormaechei]MCU3017172.1 restriction endonuclease subunit S [Enterobacter hormaechei subsp. oharae]HAT2780619.1 restriction endonuclease subunit S [Citrobacter koseri]CZU94086.1 EcoKI restriction-modification system protein HsdS [Enterobacter hormaechei]CZV04592.1 EcoKI restriction-modification system protein HsdS [Enterobacter hormaechei]CZV25918.1 EcoKI restriction-modification system protein HsdS [Enterobacter hormaechei]